MELGTGDLVTESKLVLLAAPQANKLRAELLRRGIVTLFRKPADSGLPWWRSGKNPPANAGDTGSIPGLGRSHVPRSN